MQNCSRTRRCTSYMNGHPATLRQGAVLHCPILLHINLQALTAQARTHRCACRQADHPVNRLTKVPVVVSTTTASPSLTNVGTDNFAPVSSSTVLPPLEALLPLV